MKQFKGSKLKNALEGIVKRMERLQVSDVVHVLQGRHVKICKDTKYTTARTSYTCYTCYQTVRAEGTVPYGPRRMVQNTFTFMQRLVACDAIAWAHVK